MSREKRTHEQLFTTHVDDALSSARAAQRSYERDALTMHPGARLDAVARINELLAEGRAFRDRLEADDAAVPRKARMLNVAETPLDVWRVMWRFLDRPSRRALVATCRRFASLMYEFSTHVVIEKGVHVEEFCRTAARLNAVEWARFSRTLTHVKLAYTRRLGAEWGRLAEFFAQRVASPHTVVLSVVVSGKTSNPRRGSMLSCGGLHVECVTHPHPWRGGGTYVLADLGDFLRHVAPEALVGLAITANGAPSHIDENLPCLEEKFSKTLRYLLWGVRVHGVESAMYDRKLSHELTLGSSQSYNPCHMKPASERYPALQRVAFARDPSICAPSLLRAMMMSNGAEPPGLSDSE
jgi:hypothetical protein